MDGAHQRQHSFPRAAGLLAGLALGLGPPVALAQGLCTRPFATGRLFETVETIKCNPGGAADPSLDPFCLQEVSQGFGTRIADARLEGTIDGPEGLNGAATVEASSILSQVDWIGPAHGTIIAGDSRTVFSGQLNLSLARMGIPLAPISGKWRGTKGLQAGGEFAGAFFVPLACPPESGLHGACYVRLDEQGNIVGFVQAETPTGIPQVKLEVTFCGK
jgi:hypothetical protein